MLDLFHYCNFVYYNFVQFFVLILIYDINALNFFLFSFVLCSCIDIYGYTHIYGYTCICMDMHTYIYYFYSFIILSHRCCASVKPSVYIDRHTVTPLNVWSHTLSLQMWFVRASPSFVQSDDPSKEITTFPLVPVTGSTSPVQLHTVAIVAPRTVYGVPNVLQFCGSKNVVQNVEHGFVAYAYLSSSLP